MKNVTKELLSKAKRIYKDASRGYNYNSDIYIELSSKIQLNDQEIKELRKAKQNRIRFMAQITTLEDLFGTSNLV